MSSLTCVNDLPAQIINEILSRLPTKSIIHCRCVCRTWRNLLLDPGFANLHLSKSPASLFMHQHGHLLPVPEADIFNLIELEDDHDCYDLHNDPVMKFDLRPCFADAHIYVVNSVNGLVCLCKFNQNDAIYICNPTMRQCITLPRPKYKREYPSQVLYGFGFGPVSRCYKVVQLFEGPITDPTTSSSSQRYEAEVYTLGKGKWRSVPNVPRYSQDCRANCVYLSGNIHWLIPDAESPEMINAFDVEKEQFHLVSSPPGLSRGTWMKSLGLLRGCLCVCDNYSDSELLTDSDLVVWMMKDYGVKESWTKFLVINKTAHLSTLAYEVVYPLKVWGNGDTLMLWRDDYLFSYNPEQKKLEQHDICVSRDSTGEIIPFIVIEAVNHAASFCSLKDFGGEKVETF